MQFLYPIGLFALASLIVPIVIHLWKVKQGKTLKIGSISLLGEGAASNAKSIQVSDWLLLLLRCLFFILLAFILASPFITGKSIAKTQSGWIVLDQKELKDIYPANRKKIDSLRSKGFEIHHFGYGFQKLELADSLTTARETNDTTKLNYTSLLKQLNQQLPDQFPVWIFADRSAQQFDETLPTLHLAIHWQNLNPLNTEIRPNSRFLGQAYQVKTSANAVTYTPIETKPTPALNILIFPANHEDARYLKAALLAIGSYRGQKINFYTETSAPKQLDGLFWLNEKNIPESLKSSIKSNGFLFCYAGGKIKEKPSAISFANQPNPNSVQVFKSIVKTKDKGKDWWTDAYKNTLLSFNTGTPNTFTFYSKLNPQWTNLVWNESFASALMPVLYQTEPKQFGFDANNSLTPNINEPYAHFESDGKNISSKTANQPLNKFLWAIAFLVLLAERMLTFFKKPTRKPA